MREILFRGKHAERNEWVFGDIQHDYNGEPRCISDYCGSNRVKPETVGQYTGLTDKNGLKIFEGDVLQRGNGDYWVVSFHKVMFAAQKPKRPIHRLSTSYWDNFDIVGNIHDNPEFLK